MYICVGTFVLAMLLVFAGLMRSARLGTLAEEERHRRSDSR